MTYIEDTVDRYIAAWNEPDAAARRDLVAAVWEDDGSYLDPLMEGTGTDQLTAMIGAAQAQFPGHRFVLAGAPDAHHDRARFTWHLVPDGGSGVVAVGHDFAVVGEDGRFASVTGFLEHD